MNAKSITRIWIAGLIAGSSISYLYLNPEPVDTETKSEPNTTGYLLWNYETRIWELPNCDTDSDCESKYGSDSTDTVLITGSRKF